jgi:hypothetical protein
VPYRNSEAELIIDAFRGIAYPFVMIFTLAVKTIIHLVLCIWELGKWLLQPKL